MKTGDLTDLSRLKAILEERQAISDEAVDTLGLLLASGLKRSDYDQTPENCVPFAYTGGDGVHFSFADSGEGISDSSPIVMTVPVQWSKPNSVVGRNLRDFLALGLRTGYFVLEGLQYDRDKWIKILSENRYLPGLNEMEIESLRLIERRFGIEPWKHPEAHFSELEASFGYLTKPRAE